MPDGKELLDFVETDAYSERLVGIVHKAMQTFPLSSYNGSDMPSTKPLPEAFADMSRNVREGIVMNENQTKMLEEHSELLRGKKQVRELKRSFFMTIEKADQTFKLRKRWKVVIALAPVVGFAFGHGVTPIIEWIKSLF